METLDLWVAAHPVLGTVAVYFGAMGLVTLVVALVGLLHAARRGRR
jgi:hypothetical protein